MTKVAHTIKVIGWGEVREREIKFTIMLNLTIIKPKLIPGAMIGLIFGTGMRKKKRVNYG